LPKRKWCLLWSVIVISYCFSNSSKTVHIKLSFSAYFRQQLQFHLSITLPVLWTGRMITFYLQFVMTSPERRWSIDFPSWDTLYVCTTYIHSMALDQALASLTGFLIVRCIWCGIISPTINLVLATWYDHQGHLLAKPADTTWWRSRWNAGGKHGHWILPTSTYRACRVLLHAVNLWHGTDGFTSPPKEGVLRILSSLKSIDLGRVWTREPWVQLQAR
jgi:hypothetical protein